MTPYAGRTLDRLDAEPLLTKVKICCAVAKLVFQYHNSGYLCLDIKPDNIFVLTNSSEEILTELVEYIDFDSVRKKSELSFGRSLSFTKLWAAPEQSNPFSYNKICESTDIYAIGELLFWLVFGRHSDYDEHRSYSAYPFDDVSDTSIRQAVSRTAIQNTLSEIFHSTLRSSARNRFQSIGELTPLLEKLVSELENKANIVESAIRPKDFFVGRTAELEQINAAIKEHDVVFVSGIAGIGKSELVKQYVCAHKKEYDNVLYWVYDGSLETAIAKNSTVQAKGIQRIPEETDPQFAVRLLKRIREISKEYQYNNLIVIDNMDCLLEEMPSQEAWEQINHIPGKILLTTRTVEPLYTTVMIDVISDSNDLICLFGKYCQFPEEERESVRRIIEAVDSHTLLVELLAHYTSATHSTPTHTLEQMKEHGIGKLSTESVRILKDGKLSSDSVFSHVNRIFSMESIDKGQTLTLAMLAFLPPDGVFMEKFKAFYSIENYETLNWLIAHGWISCINSTDEVIRIHPAVATAVVEHLKANSALCNRMFSAFTQAIQVHKVKIISEREQVFLADSLARSTAGRFSMNGRNAAIFVEQYLSMYIKYGNVQSKLVLANFVIDILQSTLAKNQYSAVLENGYYQKTVILYELCQYKNAIPICKEHLAKAKKNKDIYFTAKWYLLLANLNFGSISSHDLINASQRRSDSVKEQVQHIRKQMIHECAIILHSLLLYYISVCYTIYLFVDTRMRKPKFLSAARLSDVLDYDYMEEHKIDFVPTLIKGFATGRESFLAMELFCTKANKDEMDNLKEAIKIRKKVDSKDGKIYNTSNSAEIVIDKARIAFLSERYDEAEELLNSLAVFSQENDLANSSLTYRIHHFLAQIALRRNPPDYSKAIVEFRHCLAISKEISYSNTYQVRQELGYTYAISGKLEAAKAINEDLLRETVLLAPEVRFLYHADALRNIGVLNYFLGDYETALEMLTDAKQEYISAYGSIKLTSLITFGLARTHRYLAECYESLSLSKASFTKTKEYADNAKDCIETSKSCYEDTVGLNHPEAIDCLRQLERLKSQL